MKTPISKDTLQFLGDLSRHNNRDWFERHRNKYEAARNNMIEFVDGLIATMNAHDDLETPSGKKSLYRIYNDVRFSKDKTPYNPRFSGYLKRRKPYLRGGYYYWIKPGASRIACGFSYPQPDDLRRIRQDIDLNHDEWRKLLKRPGLVKSFGAMQGDQLMTSPQGYSREHPAIDLLRYKQFWFEHSFSDKEVISNDFQKSISAHFKQIRPFFDHLSEVLTTDANGESLL